jgi:hypothetical protein
MQPVSLKQASDRASVCATCPMNEKSVNPISALPFLVLSAYRLANRSQLKTPGNANLHTCTACGCLLKLKVWTPLKHIKSVSGWDEGLPDQCWILQENKNEL